MFTQKAKSKLLKKKEKSLAWKIIVKYHYEKNIYNFELYRDQFREGWGLKCRIHMRLKREKIIKNV